MNVEQKIERALINYLSEVHSIDAVYAKFYMTHSSLNDGCDTCGWGGTGMTFEISYRVNGNHRGECLTLDGDPIDFLPTLLDYDYEV